MATEYHHPVTENQSLSVEFTKRLPDSDNRAMDHYEELAEIRRDNLRRFLKREGMNKTDLAKKYAAQQGKTEPRPGFFSELLSAKEPRPGSKKRSFAEKLAWNIEEAVALKRGQLSIRNSPLEMIAPKVRDSREQLHKEIEYMSLAEVEETLAVLREHMIKKGARGKKRRAA